MKMKMDGHRWIQTTHPGHFVQKASKGITVDDYNSEDVAEVRHDSKSYFYDVELVSDDDFLGFVCGAFNFDRLEVVKNHNDFRMVVWLD